MWYSVISILLMLKLIMLLEEIFVHKQQTKITLILIYVYNAYYKCFK